MIKNKRLRKGLAMHGEGNKHINHINHSQNKFIEQINFEWMVELLYLQHIGLWNTCKEGINGLI